MGRGVGSERRGLVPWTTWIVFMGHGYAYFSPIITNHLDHFHLYFPLRIPFSGLPEIEIDL